MAASISLNIVQNSQNAASNKSNVTVSIIIKWDYGSYNLTNPPGTITIDGTKYNFNASYNSGQLTSGSQTLYSKTVDVSHDDEGKKKLSCSATYDTEGVSGVVTASASKGLTQIARASTIGATDANIGSVSAISVSKKASAYTHSIAYKFGSLTGYITASGGVSSSEVKFSGSSIPFTVPTSFYAQIPSAKTGTVTLTCRTYSGSTLIGTDTCTFTVTAAQSACTPTVSGTVVDSNGATKALTGNEAKLVRYMSTALCTISASARNSASLTGKKINNVSVETSRSIANVETNSFNFYAVDSRGYATSLTVKADMISYVILTCNVTATRDAPTTGDATIKIKGNYFNGSFGSQSNSLSVKYRISGGSYVTVTPIISGNTYSVSVPLAGMDYQQSYTIDVVVSDKLNSISKSTVLQKGLPVFNWGENGFNFHVPIKIGDTQLTETQLKQLLSLMANIKDYLSSRIQCGWFDPGEIAANGWQDYTLTFPKPFSKTPRVLVSVYSNTTSQGYTKLAVVVQKQTETGFVLRFISGYNYALEPTINWIAMIED